MASKRTGSTVDLSPDEEREVEQRSPPRAAVLFETIRREGETELERPTISLALSGLAAGLSMGASLAGEGLIRSMLPDAAWRPLAVSFGYTLGFMIVILGRQQLFTENTITPILPLLDGDDKLRKFVQVLRLWAVVLVTNILGAGIFAFAAAHSTIFSEDVRQSFLEIGKEAVAPGFGSIVVRGIASGWLIALMVWMLPGADTTRPFIVLLITYFVGLGSFSHIIAGSVEAIYLVATGHLTWLGYAGGFLLPVFIGNVIGGTSLVAILNYGQVATE